MGWNNDEHVPTSSIVAGCRHEYSVGVGKVCVGNECIMWRNRFSRAKRGVGRSPLTRSWGWVPLSDGSDMDGGEGVLTRSNH